jgi:hypothetical protein
MPTFLYGFGYEDKIDMEVNRRLGTDYESSTGVFIDAASEEGVLEWGREISEAFLRYEHDDPSISWRAIGYAHWIESDPPSCDWKHCLSFFQRVRVGEFPDFSRMTTEAYYDWCRENGLP